MRCPFAVPRSPRWDRTKRNRYNEQKVGHHHLSILSDITRRFHRARSRCYWHRQLKISWQEELKPFERCIKDEYHEGWEPCAQQSVQAALQSIYWTKDHAVAFNDILVHCSSNWRPAKNWLLSKFSQGSPTRWVLISSKHVLFADTKDYFERPFFCSV